MDTGTAEVILEQETREFWTVARSAAEAINHRETDWTREEAADILRERLGRRVEESRPPRLFRITRSAVEYAAPRFSAAAQQEVAE